MKDITAKDLLKHSFVISIDEERLKWFNKVFIESSKLTVVNGMMYIPYDKTIPEEQAIELGFSDAFEIANG